MAASPVALQPAPPGEAGESRRANRFDALSPRRQRWICLAFAVVLLLMGEALARGLENLRQATRARLDPLLLRGLIVDPRVLDEQDGSRFMRFDPYLGYRLVPYQGRSLTINRLGLRGRDPAQPKPAGARRVVVVGGSTAFGFGASSDDATLPGQLEALLRQATGRPVEVLNAGVPGYNAAQSLLQLELVLLPLQPDLVVIYGGSEDLYQATLPGWEPDSSPHLARLERQVHFSFTERGESAWSSFAVEGLRLGTVLAHRSLLVQDGAAFLAGLWRSMAPVHVVPYRYNRAGIETWVANVANEVALSQAAGARALVVLDPVIGVANKPLSRREQLIGMLAGREEGLLPVRAAMVSQGALAMREASLRQGFSFWDANQALGQNTRTLFFDNFHLTDDGNRVIAAQVAAWILGEHLLDG